MEPRGLGGGAADSGGEQDGGKQAVRGSLEVGERVEVALDEQHGGGRPA